VSSIYLYDLISSFNIGAGSALSGSHKWVGTLFDDALTSLAVVTINSGALNTWRSTTTPVNQVSGSGVFEFGTDWTKTGTPGNIYVLHLLTYRIIAT
jgi:hypothetical protein